MRKRDGAEGKTRLLAARVSGSQDPAVEDVPRVVCTMERGWFGLGGLSIDGQTDGEQEPRLRLNESTAPT